MSGLELMIDEADGCLYAAVLKKGILHDLYADAAENPASWASIYLGKVTKIDKRLDAAIVDLGNGQQGFLAAKHVSFPGEEKPSARAGIADLLSPGQSVIVQIKSEAKRGTTHEKDKMPRLTMKLYIMGQYLVYSPTPGANATSRRVKNEAALDAIAKLTKAKNEGSWILRVGADSAAAEAIHGEAARLLKKYEKINAALNNGDPTPRIALRGLNALSRALNDYGANAFEHIHAGNRAIFEKLEKWCAKNDPPLATSKRLRLFKPEKPGQVLFDIHDVLENIETLSDKTLHLKNGGTIIIENTHALTVIDVNQGAGGSAPETNLEAAQEITKQIRLRNMSGAILVDFIGMGQKTDRADLLEKVERFFAADDTAVQVHGFTRLGIMEITRKRRSATLAEKQAASRPAKLSPGVSLDKKSPETAPKSRYLSGA
jgi:ribonuclease G